MHLTQSVLMRGAMILFAVSLAACGPSTPAAVPQSPTDTSTAASATPPPTETPVPTPISPTPTATASAPTAAATLPAVGPGGKATGDEYQYVGQDLPDNYEVSPGREITITWTVKNTGTNGWSSTYSLRYFTGVKASKDVYPFTKTTPPGKTTTLSVTIVAPLIPGAYDTWWKLVNPQGQNFGDVDFVFIVK